MSEGGTDGLIAYALLPESRTRSGRRAAPTALWLALWAAAGVLAAVGVLGVFTIGPAALVAACAAVAGLLAVRPTRRCAAAMLVGPGIVLVMTAWFDRGGPNWSCTRTVTPVGNAVSVGQMCSETPSPVPALVIGVALVAAGVIGTCVLFRVRRDA